MQQVKAVSQSVGLTKSLQQALYQDRQHGLVTTARQAPNFNNIVVLYSYNENNIFLQCYVFLETVVIVLIVSVLKYSQ